MSGNLVWQEHAEALSSTLRFRNLAGIYSFEEAKYDDQVAQGFLSGGIAGRHRHYRRTHCPAVARTTSMIQSSYAALKLSPWDLTNWVQASSASLRVGYSPTTS